ncbi:Ig-like domain-containing protein [Brevibacillus brevis]|uniref:Ig-like domain-containing protein n=1 Tax=Brevibacillus brevis TaxID=1393 RepID=UPI0037CC473C
MNKKVALSVLSTAVVASMAASAYAAPQAGVYVGGDVKKFYSTTTLLNLTKEAKAQYAKDLRVGSDNLVFVHINGKGAFFSEIIKDGSAAAFAQPLKKSDFVDLYKVVKPDGTSTETEDAKAKVPDDATGDLKVESVSAINLNQLEVTFSKKVDKSSATSAGNYKLNNIALATGNASVKLKDDGKTVVITLATPRTQSEEVTVTVSGVQEDKTFALVPTATKVVSFTDVTAPTISSVAVAGNTKLTVKFSESVKEAVSGNIGSYLTINGLPLTAYNASASFTKIGNFGDTVEVNFSSPLATGTYKLNIGVGLSDAAGFPVAKQDKDFTVQADTAAPVVSSTTASTSGLVTVVFNKAISAASLINAFSINGVSPVTGALKEDGVTVEVQFGPNDVKAGANVLEINKNVADVYGNKLSATENIRVAVNASSDATAPTVSSVVVTDDSHFTVVFSEPVNSVYANNAANYNLYDASNAKVTSTYFTGASFVTRTTPGQTNMVDVALASGKVLPGGTYRLEIANVKDLAGNTMAVYSTNLTSPDKTAPDFATGTQGIAYATGNKVEVFFNEAMAVSGAGSIVNPANYSYSTDSGTSWKTIPSTATVTQGIGNKSVIFTFGPDVLATSINKVRAANVTDVAGNVIKDIAPIATIVAPTGAAKVAILNTSSSYPTLKLNGTVASVSFQTDRPLVSVLPKDFVVNSQTPDTASLNGTTVTLNFTTASKVTALEALGKTVALGTIANPVGSKDAAGVLLNAYTNADVIRIDDKITPIIVANGVKQVAGSTTKVEVTFNENIDSSIVGLYKDDFIVTVNGAPVTITNATVSGSKTLELTAKTSLVGTVAVVPGADSVISILDENGNKYVPSTDDKKGFTFTVTAPAVPAPEITTHTVAQGSVTGATKVTYAAGAGNDLKVVKQANSVTVPNVGDDASAVGAAYTSGDDIVAAVAGEHVGLYEVDAAGKVVKFVDITLTTGDIKAPAPVSAPEITTHTVAQGSVTGATKVTYAAGTGNDLKVVKQANAVTVPNVGDDASTIGTAYTSGDDITAAVAGEHVGLYEVDAAGKVVKFVDITLTVTNIAQ